MAKMHPPRFPNPKDGGRRAERDFYEACQDQLDDTWTVLYGVAWHGKREKNRVERGDADFILMSESFGLYAIEVKGGAKIEVEKGIWYSTPNWSNEKKEIKDPFVQVSGSISVLWKFIEQNIPQVKLNGPFGHLVVFPGHVQEGPMGMHGPRALICDRNDMKNLVRTLSGARKYRERNSRLSSNDISAIKEKLMPSFTLGGPQYLNLNDTVDELNRLTDYQLAAFSGLNKEPQLTVVGGPGTGKTILAFNKAKQLANQGLSALYLCSSNALAQDLEMQKLGWSEDIQKNLTILSISGFRLMHYNIFLRQSGLEVVDGSGLFDINYPLMDEFWRMDFPQKIQLLRNETREGGLYDALIIDEAQVIAPMIYDFAVTLLGESRFIYIFGDENQNWINRNAFFGYNNNSILNVYGSEKSYELNINCRSTAEIVDFSSLFIGNDSKQLIGSEVKRFEPKGYPVEISVVESDQWVNATSRVITDWMRVFGIDITEIKLLVEPERMYEGIWGDIAGNSHFDANETGLTIHDGFAIDWWTGPNWAFGRSSLNILTEGKKYLPPGFEDENDFGASVRKSFDPRVAIDQTLQNENIWIESWNRFRKQVEAVTTPLVTATPFSDFQGMESKAVIVLNPIPNDEKYFEELYAMATRAKVLLAIIVSYDAAVVLTEAGIISGFN